MDKIVEKPIQVEQLYSAPLQIVWDAITKVDQMGRWFFNNIPAFEPIVGFETKFHVQSGDRNFTHLWRIMEVIPMRSIKYSWSYEEYQGEGFVTFELFDHGDTTLLRLTNEGLETFPQNIAEFKRENCEGGWDFFLKNQLKGFLEKSH